MKYISIEGCVGAGKTTVAHLLAEASQARVLCEQFDLNPFLADFYRSPRQYSLETEMAFLLIHYHQLKDSFLDPHGEMVVGDFFIGKDVLFANMNLSSEENELFGTLYAFLASRTRTPDILVCLHCSDHLILERIAKRKRDPELVIDSSYFVRLNGAYEEFFESLTLKRIHVDMDDRDFVAGCDNIEWLRTEVEAALSL